MRAHVCVHPHIVVVEERNELARGRREARIARGARAILRHGQMACAKFGADALRFWVLAVVADQNFEGQVVRLVRADARQRLAQRIGPIARGDDYGDDALHDVHVHSSQRS